MQTLDDNTVTIPNNKFLNDIASCGNYGALDMQVVMDFHISPDQDVDVAREIVTEAALTSRYVFLAETRCRLGDPAASRKLRLRSAAT